MESKINAIILAGGKNSRMQGEDKAFLEVGGKPIIERLIDKLRILVNEIIIVTNSPEKYLNFEAKLVKDESPDKGPLMGIYSGLRASAAKHNFVLACDMPFVSEALIRYMIEDSDDFDIVIPEVNGKLHPLLGVYSKNCIPIIEEMLKQDELRISNIFSRLKTRFISGQEAKKCDPALLSLININTKEELEKVSRRKGLKLCQSSLLPS